jgi:hypothetical protein
MPGKNNEFEGREPSTLFREFAAECMELAQTASSPEKRALYMKMASVWFQMALRWEKSPTTTLLEQAVSIQDQQEQIRDQHDCCHPCYREPKSLRRLMVT